MKKSFNPEERARCRLVGTPIGNLGDITPRAVEALSEADIIFAEDTRTARALLHHLNISKPIESYHKDNEHTAVHSVISKIEDGKKVALISEAGMPVLSDPGFLLVQRLLAEKLPFEVIPGVNAATHAAVASGLCPNGHFLFAGFLPTKGAKSKIEELRKIPYPIIFYESPHRVKQTLKLLADHFGFPIAICRELTKLYEEVYWINNIAEIEEITVKGEFCIVVNNSDTAAKSSSELSFDINIMIDTLKKNNVNNKTVVEVLKACGIKRNEAYKMMHNGSDSDNDNDNDNDNEHKNSDRDDKKDKDNDSDGEHKNSDRDDKSDKDNDSDGEHKNSDRDDKSDSDNY